MVHFVSRQSLAVDGCSMDGYHTDISGLRAISVHMQRQKLLTVWGLSFSESCSSSGGAAPLAVSSDHSDSSVSASYTWYEDDPHVSISR